MTLQSTRVVCFPFCERATHSRRASTAKTNLSIFSRLRSRNSLTKFAFLWLKRPSLASTIHDGVESFDSNSHKRPTDAYRQKDVKMIYPRPMTTLAIAGDLASKKIKRASMRQKKNRGKSWIIEIITLTGGWRLAWYYFSKKETLFHWKNTSRYKLNEITALRTYLSDEIDYRAVTKTQRMFRRPFGFRGECQVNVETVDGFDWLSAITSFQFHYTLSNDTQNESRSSLTDHSPLTDQKFSVF